MGGGSLQGPGVTWLDLGFVGAHWGVISVLLHFFYTVTPLQLPEALNEAVGKAEATG